MLKNCLACQGEFAVTAEDQAFYRKVSPVIGEKVFLLPEPDHCPECRQKRRLRFRNERNLFARRCDLCQKDILAIYPQDSVFPVYCPECWWSDKWDATSLGRQPNATTTIASQIGTLLHSVPRMSLVNFNSENSTYAHDAEGNKNCYLIFSASGCEDCLYITDSAQMKNCVDCYWSNTCQLCYDVISCSECYQSYFSIHCYQLNFSYFCYDSQNCSNCFGCFHVTHQEYCIFNQQYTKAEYEQKLASYRERLKTWQGYLSVWQEVKAFWQKQAHKYATVICENCTGDFLVDCKNCFQCFNIVGSEDCQFLYDCIFMKDSQDCSVSIRSELIYNCQSCIGFMMLCSSFSSHCVNVAYSDLCFNCNNCFGCVGLRHKEYCIFNVQYSKETYEKLLPTIIQQTMQEKLWGNFLPPELSPVEEKHSVVDLYFPPPDEVAIEQVIQSSSDNPIVTNNTITCLACKKDFRLIKQEITFYQQHGLPVPPICSVCRHKRRMQQRNPRKIYDRSCDQCHQAVKSTFIPGDPTIIYCEKCYQLMNA